MSRFAQLLGGEAGRVVLDRTELTGTWNLELEYAATPNASPSNDGLGLPSLFTAIEEQLGLKLEPTRGPVEVLVIDSVERPTPD